MWEEKKRDVFSARIIYKTCGQKSTLWASFNATPETAKKLDVCASGARDESLAKIIAILLQE